MVERDDLSRERYSKRRAVISLENLIKCDLPREITYGSILFFESNPDLQNTFEPRLGIFDRFRSRGRSYHAFHVQYRFGVLLRKFR